MAWTLEGTAGGGGATANASFAWGVTPAEGELLIAWCNSDTVIAISSAGWTAGPTILDGNDADCYWKIAGASESSTVAFTNSAANWAVGGLRYTNDVAGTITLETSNSANAGSSGTTTPAASVTTADAGDLVVAIGALHSFISGIPTTPVWSSGFTGRQNLGSGAGSTHAHTFVGDNQNAGSGSIAPNVSWTNSVNDRTILVLAFVPPAAPPGSPGGLTSQVRFIAAGALANNATTAAIACTGPACAVNDILIYAGMGKNNQVVGVPDGSWTKFVEINNTANQRITLAWKRAVIGDIGGISYAFTKPVDDNLLNIGVISAWRGCRTNGTPIDATTPTNSPNASSDTVTYATFNPTEFMAYVVAVGVYNDDLTTAGTISGTDPTLTNRWDLETATGTDGSCFGYSGPSTGVATGARSHSTTSTNDAVNIGVLFGLVSDDFPLPSDWAKRQRFSSHLAM